MRDGIVSLALAQVRPGTPVERLAERLTGQDADVVALPEYVTARPGEKGQTETAAHLARDMEALAGLAATLGRVLLAGTVVETAPGGLWNTAPCFENGRLVGRHRKVHPTERERQAGILPGDGFRAVEAGGLRIVTLICADVLHTSSFDRAAAEDPDLVFVPATSPLRPGEDVEDKKARDRAIFLEGAARSRAFVAKACAAGEIYGRPLQGRSLVAAPWGEMLARVPPEREAEELVLRTSLDLAALAAWRRRTAGTRP